MGLNLNKGSRFNLTKDAPSLKKAGIGLGWSPNTTPNGPDFDLDVSAFLLTQDSKVVHESYVVYFNSELTKETPEGRRPMSGDESVLGAIDSLDGTESDGADDEDMRIDFEKVWEGITQIVITVTITKYPNDRKKDRRTLLQNFGMIDDCYIRVWDEKSGVEILKYNLKEDFKNEDAVEFGRFVKVNNSWEFVATGDKYVGGLEVFINQFT